MMGTATARLGSGHVAAGSRCVRVGLGVTNRPGTPNYDHRHAHAAIIAEGSTSIRRKGPI
jgi:hypothetical protein